MTCFSVRGVSRLQRVGVTGGLRERDARGHSSPTLCRESRVRVAGSSCSSVRLRLGGRPAVLVLQPASPRSRDERCPSESSQGEVLACVRRPALRRTRSQCERSPRGCTPEQNAQGEAGGFGRTAPDPAKFGWCSVKAPFGPQGLDEADTSAPPGFWRSMRRMGPPPRPEETPSPARAGVQPRRDQPGVGRFVVVLVGCPGCRSRREASDPASSDAGIRRSKPPAQCAGRWRALGDPALLAPVDAQAEAECGAEAKVLGGGDRRSAQAERTTRAVAEERALRRWKASWFQRNSGL